MSAYKYTAIPAQDYEKGQLLDEVNTVSAIEPIPVVYAHSDNRKRRCIRFFAAFLLLFLSIHAFVSLDYCVISVIGCRHAVYARLKMFETCHF